MFKPNQFKIVYNGRTVIASRVKGHWDYYESYIDGARFAGNKRTLKIKIQMYLANGGGVGTCKPE